MKEVLKGIMYIGIFSVPFIPLLVANSQFFPFITGKNFPFRIIVEIVFASWVLLALFDTEFRPRFSWILASFVAFVTAIFFADLFGQYPLKSFWSNFERMEGWVTLIHLLAYFLVAASVLRTPKIQIWFFNTMLFAGTLMLFYSFGQIIGTIDTGQNTERIDGRLGNAAYNAIYMLFHAFIAMLMLVRTKSKNLRILYGVLTIAFVYVLFMTATRGAILGITGGVLLAAIYIVLFGKGYGTIRKVGTWTFIAVIVLIVGFIGIRDTEFVKSSSVLSRVASITLEEGSTRFTIWGMAFEGFKERPILGWGQENFSYVFNKEYQPSLYAQEQWFDRVHNIFFDWLIAGGIVGLGTYLALLFATVYYVALRPLFRKDDATFTVVERGLLIGLIAGYFFHNLFVFDNIVSYILYVTILAFVHARISTEIPRLIAFTINRKVVAQVITPIVAVVLLGTIYFVNAPGLQASSDLIRAFGFINTVSQNGQLTTAQRDILYRQGLESLESALAHDSFADQEIREQFARIAQTIINDPNVSPEIKEVYRARAEEELLKQIEEKPDDTRGHVFTGSFYRFVQDFPAALRQFERARELSPQKQSILLEIGLVHMNVGQHEEAKEVLQEMFELEPRYDQARYLYAVSAIFTNDWELFEELIGPQYEKAFINHSLGASTLFSTGNYSRLADILSRLIEVEPNNLQYRISLAITQERMGNTALAIQTLREAITLFPSFKTQGEQIIADLLSGKSPSI